MSSTKASLKSFIKTLTHEPGIYKMLDEKDKVIYVGKAKNLKKRVSSYFNKTHDSPKTTAMVANIASIEVVVTHSEKEALLLENQLIKTLRPRYNIFFRDDKSYPYIHMTTDDEFPRVLYYRGERRKKGAYFGPYTNASAVREAIIDIQKVFQLRTCNDTFFNNRSRPCLEHQIKRCSAPCVGLITKASYQKDVAQARLFLKGKSKEVIENLSTQMEAASYTLNFELAAVLRDRIYRLRQIFEKQYVAGVTGKVDVVAIAEQSGSVCIQVLFIRDGELRQTRRFIQKTSLDDTTSKVMQFFLTQFYLEGGHHGIPNEIVISHDFADKKLLQTVFFNQCQQQIKFVIKPRTLKAKWLSLAKKNAEDALLHHLNDDKRAEAQVVQLEQDLALASLPMHMECFDISHTSGQFTIASCVVFKAGRPDKRAYRRFNISVTPGDDYAAIEAAVLKRYHNHKTSKRPLPDLVLIDGGKGQLQAACDAFEKLALVDVPVIAIAKGPARKPGMEKLFFVAKDEAKTLAADSESLHLLQAIRDEAHRFAISGHRAKRSKLSRQSILEEIEGVGAKKRQALLKHFGGLQGVEKASCEALSEVPGISDALAKRIYEVFHGAQYT